MSSGLPYREFQMESAQKVQQSRRAQRWQRMFLTCSCWPRGCCRHIPASNYFPLHSPGLPLSSLLEVGTESGLLVDASSTDFMILLSVGCSILGSPVLASLLLGTLQASTVQVFLFAKRPGAGRMSRCPSWEIAGCCWH